MMKSRNYVMEAANSYFHREGKYDEIKKLYEDAMRRFNIIHILNAMAYSESLKAIDIIEDEGRRKQLVKKYLNMYEESYGRYEHYINRNMEHQAWVLLQDYIRVCITRIEPSLLMLKLACHDYLNRKKSSMANLLGQCESAAVMWALATDTYKTFFELLNHSTGIDFEKDFSYADMNRCCELWNMVTNTLAKGLQGVDFGDDKRCVDCWKVLKNTLNEDFFDLSAMEALKLNPDILEQYKDELD